MKIALIGLTYPFRGGISHYTSLLCRELSKKHSVEFISLKSQYPRFLFPGKTQIDESQKPIDVENHPILHPLLPWSWIRAFFKIKTFAPDLVLFQWWHPYFAPSFGTLALLLKYGGQAKVVFLCHNVRPHEPTQMDSLLLRYAYKAPDHFIVHAESDLLLLKALKPQSRIVKTPHPTYEIFSSSKRADPLQVKKGLGIEGNTLLFFGYIRKYKGLEYLLQAFPRVLREIDATLLIVGEIYEGRETILEMIERSPFREKIRLVDHYVPNEDVELYFSAADVVVLPYLSATQSGIIQIAYGFNKPVISTKVGGIPEVVAEGQTGFLVEPGNAEALATAIVTFYQHRDTIDFRRNIENLKDRFAWERIVEVIERIHGES